MFAERAFALFLGRLAGRLDRLVVVGRLRPERGDGRYPLPATIDFVGLPYYETIAQPLAASRAMFRSLFSFWCALDDVDACWLLGPHPLALCFAVIAVLRRRRVILGVRQDLPEYARSRHPGRRRFAFAAVALDCCYRGLARRCATIVVGPALRHQYRRSRTLLEIVVSLVEPDDVVAAEAVLAKPYDEDLTLLSVGRIDEEKNPLLLADVIAGLADRDPRWRLVVCGEGPLENALRDRLGELGVGERAELRGYVIQGDEMRATYRAGHALLHVSRTEGLPQVLIEALAAGLPVVATDVGGIREALSDAAALVAPDDAEAAIRTLREIAGDPQRRAELIRAGIAYASAHTLDAEVNRVAAFIGDQLDADSRSVRGARRSARSQ